MYDNNIIIILYNCNIVEIIRKFESQRYDNGNALGVRQFSGTSGEP